MRDIDTQAPISVQPKTTRRWIWISFLVGFLPVWLLVMSWSSWTLGAVDNVRSAALAAAFFGVPAGLFVLSIATLFFAPSKRWLAVAFIVGFCLPTLMAVTAEGNLQHDYGKYGRWEPVIQKVFLGCLGLGPLFALPVVAMTWMFRLLKKRFSSLLL